MSNKFLILGATGAIGFSFTNELLKKEESVSILVRDKQKARTLYKNHPKLKVIVGDIKNVELLKDISNDKQFIFFGINFPYQRWESEFVAALRNTIEAAKQNRATILFPENNYCFGKIQESITENSTPKPTTKKGEIRFEMIQMLQKATLQTVCKAIVVRLPDFFGPNVTNGLIKPIFGNAVKNKPVSWLINADIPHQFAYTPDVARIFYKLTKLNNLPNWFLINYGGKTVESINELSEKISSYAGNSQKVKVAPKMVLNLLGLFVSDVRELKENYYQFEQSIILDDSKLKNILPDFQSTKLEKSIKHTIDWYKENMINLP